MTKSGDVFSGLGKQESKVEINFLSNKTPKRNVFHSSCQELPTSVLQKIQSLLQMHFCCTQCHNHFNGAYNNLFCRDMQV